MGIIARMNVSTGINAKYYNTALWLACLTIGYNILEGLVSVYFGAQDETLALFGFGLDSFIEVLSGLGILVMVLNLRRHMEESGERFERAALRVSEQRTDFLTHSGENL